MAREEIEGEGMSGRKREGGKNTHSKSRHINRRNRFSLSRIGRDLSLSPIWVCVGEARERE